MQDLSNEIRKVTNETILDTDQHLRETAKKWASYVLENNTDKALELGLKISESICNYLNEIKID